MTMMSCRCSKPATSPRAGCLATMLRMVPLPRFAEEDPRKECARVAGDDKDRFIHPHFPHFWAVRNAFLINGVKIFGAVSFATRLNGLILRAWTEGSPLRAHWRSSCGRSLGRKIWSAAKDFSGRGYTTRLFTPLRNLLRSAFANFDPPSRGG